MSEFDMGNDLDNQDVKQPDPFYTEMFELSQKESLGPETGLLDIYPFKDSIAPIVSKIFEEKEVYINPESQKDFDPTQLFLNTVLLFNSIPNKEPYGISYAARANLIRDTAGFSYFKKHFQRDKLEMYFKETDGMLAELFKMPLLKEYLMSQFTVEGKRTVSSNQLKKDINSRFCPPTYAQYFIKFIGDKYSGIKEVTLPLGLSNSGNISSTLNQSIGRGHLNR